MTKEEKIKAIYEEIAEGVHDSYSEDETIFPVMIGDVLDYIDSIEFNHPKDFMKWYKEKYSIIINTLFTDWDYKRKPIEEQSEDCIDYIYNLIKNELCENN